MNDLLVERWRKGDFKAFIELVRPCIPSIRALIACYAPTGESAWDYDDIAQDVLIEAFKASKNFDSAKADLPAWLKGVARNRTRRAWQEAARNKQRMEASFEAARSAAERAMARDLDADPLIEALQKCMSKLPVRSAEVIRAHYAEGQSVAEIAKRLQRSANNLYVELHRIRVALRNCVEESVGRGEGEGVQAHE